MTAARGWLRAGRVGRPHGLDGSFYVTDPKPQLLRPGQDIILGGSPARVAERKGSDRRPIVRLDAPAERAGAEALRGAELLVARELAPDLDPNEWWEEDLEGCAVLAAGRELGIVRRLIALPSCEALEVARGDQGDDLLVPLVADAVIEVDIEHQRIEVDPIFLGEDRA